MFYRNVLSEEERDRLTSNIAGHVCNAKPEIQKKVVEMFSKCDPDYGARIAKKLKVSGCGFRAGPTVETRGNFSYLVDFVAAVDATSFH